VTKQSDESFLRCLGRRPRRADGHAVALRVFKHDHSQLHRQLRSIVCTRSCACAPFLQCDGNG
jgi:hypothetical protein